MPEFHAEAPQATASEGLAQGPYVVARVGFKPMTLRTKVVESTNESPQSRCYFYYVILLLKQLLFLEIGCNEIMAVVLDEQALIKSSVARCLALVLCRRSKRSLGWN